MAVFAPTTDETHLSQRSSSSMDGPPSKFEKSAFGSSANEKLPHFASARLLSCRENNLLFVYKLTFW